MLLCYKINVQVECIQSAQRLKFLYMGTGTCAGNHLDQEVGF